MNRIAELRKKAQLSQAQFGKIIGAAQNTVSQWENGNREPDFETAQKISDFFNTSIDYLLGRDDTYSSPAKGVWIPVLGKVQAGIPVEAVEDVLDHEEITKEMASQGEFFALQVKGDSMEPRIKEGDVVIVRKQSDADTGDIAVVLVNGDDATVKRIKKRPEGIMLIPNNPAYEPMFYSSEEVEKLPVVIVGKVVELRAKL